MLGSRRWADGEVCVLIAPVALCIALWAGCAAEDGGPPAFGGPTPRAGDADDADHRGDSSEADAVGDGDVSGHAPDVSPWPGAPGADTERPSGGRAGAYEPCESPSDCASGYCVQAWSGAVCAPTCNGDCETGWVCTQDLSSLPDVVFVCLPAHPQLCAPCRSDADCLSLGSSTSRCVRYGDEGAFCGGDCGTLDCPEGFSCLEVEVAGSATPALQCVLDEGICPCTPSAIAAGASTRCASANAHGVCEGERVCTEGGLTPCSAPAPAPELCNGLDDDCNGLTDEGLVGGPCLAENEHGACPGVLECDGAGLSVCGAREPAAEACNGVDDDCDGFTDEANAQGCTPFYVDADGDGWGAGEPACLCGPEGQYSAGQPGDCDDLDAAVNPAAVEICNGIDDDCDGVVDEPGAEGCAQLFLDADGDGFGQDGTEQCLCGAAGPYTATEGGDCDDGNAAVNPAAVEVCNGVDDDCDGVTDGEGAVGCTAFFADGDGDGWGVADDFVCACAPGPLYAAINAGDCDDSDPAVNPAAVEVCNGIDDDCDGLVDEGAAVGCTFFFVDADSDGWGQPGTATCLCAPAGGATASQAGDCDDSDPAVNPGAVEVCNGQDDNCNGLVDEPGAEGCQVYYADADGDGFGTSQSLCACAPTGVFTATQPGDCNDSQPGINPAAEEVCNGVDDDCDGEIDEPGAVGCVAFYFDGDGDGWGVGEAECLCGPSGAYTAKAPGDCDDEDAAVHPGAVEACNGVDDDCDGLTDGPNSQGCAVYYADQDGDGFGVITQPSCLCGPQGVHTATQAGDCDDADPAVSPGATEVCNGIDDNCDGGIDEGCGLATGGWPTYKFDARRTGHRPGVAGPKSNAVGWKYTLSPGTSLQNSVALIDDGIIAMGGKKLVKLDYAGQVMWSEDLPVNVFWRNSPTVREGGTVLVPVGGELRLYASSGERLWTTTLAGESITAAPIVDAAGAIYVLSTAGLRKIDAAGQVLWVAPAPNTQSSPGHPAISPNGNIHFATSNHSVYSIIPQTGQAAWIYTHPGGADTDSSVAIAPNGDVYQGFGTTIERLSPEGVKLGGVGAGGDMDGDVSLLWDPVDDALKVYASPNGNSGLRRYSASLSLEWTYSLSKDQSSNGVPVLDADGDGYVGDDTGKFVCVRRNGTLRWSYTTGSPKVKSVAAIGPGFLVFGDNSGVLHFIGNYEGAP